MTDVIFGIDFQKERIVRFINSFKKEGKLPSFFSTSTEEDIFDDWKKRLGEEFYPIIDEMSKALDTMKSSEEDIQPNYEKELDNEISNLIRNLNISKIKLQTPTIRPNKQLNSELYTLISDISIIYERIVQRKSISDRDVFKVKLLRKHFYPILNAFKDDLVIIDSISSKYKDIDDIKISPVWKTLQSFVSEFNRCIEVIMKMRKFLQYPLFVED